MTPNGVIAPAAEGQRVNVEGLGNAALGVIRYFRPSDGWAALVLLTLNLLVVIYSVEQADWVDTPNLAGVLLIAMVAGLFLARVPLWAVLVLPLGLALGLLVIVWRLTDLVSRSVQVTSADQLWDRLLLWYEAAKTGSINIDAVPFAFGLLVATWLCGYLATWVFVRYRNFWGVFILGGAGIMSNLTYLPPNASVQLGLFLFTAFLLVARVQSVRRRREWEARQVSYDGHLSALSLSDSFILAMAVLLIAFLLPAGGKYGPANDAYELFRTPIRGWEDDFNRLFAGLPARKPLGYRIWGDVMAFQGTIHPTKAQVLFVESEVPLYWKARSYSTYTPKGWISDETTLKPNDWTPAVSVPQPYLSRFDISYTVTPNYDSRTLFAGDQVIGIDRDVRLETYDSPTYTLDVHGAGNGRALSPKLADTAATLRQTLALGGESVSDSSLASRLPDEFRLVESVRSRGSVDRVVLAEVLPARPDILSVQSTGREIKALDSYEITSSVSIATASELRRAGTDYPTYVVARYTQLDDELPDRVRDLALQLTAGADTPYDKAKALEFYLSGLPYTLEVEPPPFDADGVDHFLFTLGEGYSEYFSSAMTVMLRSIDIPAPVRNGVHHRRQGERTRTYTWSPTAIATVGWKSICRTTVGFHSSRLPAGRSRFRPRQCLRKYWPGKLVRRERWTMKNAWKNSRSATRPSWTLRATVLARCPSPGAVDLPPCSCGSPAVLPGPACWASWSGWAGESFMTPSDDPQTAFRRMAALGRLASVGPASHQTPFQYRQRLSNTIPDHRGAVSVVIDYYVRSIYGRKELDEAQREELTQAWLSLRMALFLRILRPRNI